MMWRTSFPFLTGEWRWRTPRFGKRPILEVREVAEIHRIHLFSWFSQTLSALYRRQEYRLPIPRSQKAKFRWRDATVQDLSNPLLKNLLCPAFKEEEARRLLLTSGLTLPRS